MGLQLQSNIYKLYLIKISHWLMLTMPVIMLFYDNNHLSVRHLFIIQAVYSVTIVALEIPSGYLADVWGRKNTLIVGAILGFSGYFTYSLSSDFWGFLFAEVMLGIGHSFISGTDTAILYDTLIALDKEDKYLKVEGRMTSVGNFAEAIAGILGGLLAAYSIQSPFICQAFVALIAIPAAITLVEPKISKSGIKTTFKDVLFSFREALYRNKKLRNNLFLSSIIGASTLTMAWFVQPFFKLVNTPVSLYGILWTILNASVGVAAIMAYRFERYFKEMKTILIIIFFITLGYISLFFFPYWWAIGFILLFYLVRGLATPILKDYINKQIPSETRASVISLRNLIIRGIFSSLAPIWGWTADKISLPVALLMAGTTYFIFCLPFVILYWKCSKAEVDDKK